MTDSKDLIIISASCGKNLELSKKFHQKSIELNLSSEILDLTTFDIPLFNPRIHTKENIPNAINEIKEKLLELDQGNKEVLINYKNVEISCGLSISSEVNLQNILRSIKGIKDIEKIM